jgi:hypothetical protein
VSWLSYLLVRPAERSWLRTTGETLSRDVAPREPGEPMLPLVRFDAAYHPVESDIEAWDFRLQLGYGPLGFEANQTRYEEEDPPDRLDLTHLYALWRLSVTERIELDLGLGAVILEGDEQNAGFSGTTSVLIWPWDWLAVEFRPMWSAINDSHLQEYELGVLVNARYVALKGGYRFTRSPNESLDGPFIGVSVRY